MFISEPKKGRCSQLSSSRTLLHSSVPSLLAALDTVDMSTRQFLLLTSYFSLVCLETTKHQQLDPYKQQKWVTLGSRGWEIQDKDTSLFSVQQGPNRTTATFWVSRESGFLPWSFLYFLTIWLWQKSSALSISALSLVHRWSHPIHGLKYILVHVLVHVSFAAHHPQILVTWNHFFLSLALECPSQINKSIYLLLVVTQGSKTRITLPQWENGTWWFSRC